MNAIAKAVEELNRSTVDVHLLRPALERLEGVDLDRVANRVQRGLVDADTADAVDDLATLGAQVLPLARAAVGLADAALPGFPDEAEFGVRVEPPENGDGERLPPTVEGREAFGASEDPVDFRRHVGDELASQHEWIVETGRKMDELREIVNRLDQQVTRLVRTHPAGDANPEATDTKWLEETVADLDDRLHAVETRDRAERLDAGFRELMEKEIAHLKEQIPGELANRLLRLERAARAADLMPAT